MVNIFFLFVVMLVISVERKILKKRVIAMKTNTRKENIKITKKGKKKLLTYRACNCKLIYHPLKKKKVDPKKIKTIADVPERVVAQRRGIMSKKLSIKLKNIDFYYEDITGNEKIMFDWLAEIGIKAIKISDNLYTANNQTCSLSYLLIIANKKRISMNLKPFFIDFSSKN